MVRVGGGFAGIPEYYNKYSHKQCIELYHHLSSRQLTFKDAVIDFARKNNADDRIIEAYLDEKNADQFDNVNTIFLLLSAFFEEKKNKDLSNKKSSTKKGKKKSNKAPSDGFSPVRFNQE